jgi:hypothetical protein
MRFNRLAIFLGCGLFALPLAAGAAKSFGGPSGWNHDVIAQGGGGRTQDVWKTPDANEVLSMIADTGTSFDDAIGVIRKNAIDSKLRFGLDKDLTCDGRKAHLFEMAMGDAKKTLFDVTVIADGAGMERITYSRPDGSRFSSDVKDALTSYCGTPQ